MLRVCLAAALVQSAALAFIPTSLAADLCLGETFRCNGFEPNWQLTTSSGGIGGTIVTFIDPENPNWETAPLVIEGCLLQGSPNDFELTTPGPLSLVANIVGQSCTEPNGDLTDFSVTVTFNQGAQTPNPNLVEGTGCCTILP